MADFMVKGQVVAPIKPFSATGELLLDAFREVLRWHISCGCGGFMVAGDNGEAWALTREELALVTRTAKDEAKGRVPVFVGTSAITARETIALSQLVRDAGADGLVVQPQSYVLNGTHDEIVRRYAAISKAVPLPMLLYNHPGRTGVNMTPDILAAVCDVSPVVGLKEASDNFLQLSQIIERFSERFAVLTGPAHYIIPGILLGAVGYISTGPELLGKEAPKILAVDKMSISERRDLHSRITGLFQAVQFTGTRPAGIKAALAMLGLPAGIPREPLLPLNAADQAKVRDALVRYRALPAGGQRNAAE
jgi:4-hydroxy-tetrahydrodipicolinate synthase